MSALAACEPARVPGDDAAIPAYDAPASDRATPAPCAANADCPAWQFCQGDACTGAGVCADRPTDCAGASETLCGCDGRTYISRCEAARAGTRVAPAGMCPSPPDAARDDAARDDAARDDGAPVSDSAPDAGSDASLDGASE